MRIASAAVAETAEEAALREAWEQRRFELSDESARSQRRAAGVGDALAINPTILAPLRRSPLKRQPALFELLCLPAWP